MDNKVLIKQYVDTGLALPVTQFKKLSNNQKTTYLRKRNIAVDGGSEPKPYELKYFSEDTRVKVILRDPYYYCDLLQRQDALTDYVALESIKRKPGIFQYIHNDSEEIRIAAVEHSGHNLEYINNPSEAVQLAAVKNSSVALGYIKNPSEDVQIAAVRNSSLTLGTILTKRIEPSEKLLTTATILNPINTMFILREFDILVPEDLKMLAVTTNGKAIQFIYNPSEELQLAAVKNSPYAMGAIKNPTESTRLLNDKLYSGKINESKGKSGMKLLDIVREDFLGIN